MDQYRYGFWWKVLHELDELLLLKKKNSGQWQQLKLLKAWEKTRPAWQQITSHTLEVNDITSQLCRGKYSVYVIVYLSQKPYECSTEAEKVFFYAQLRLNLLVMHYDNQAIYSCNYGFARLSPAAITATTDQTLHAGSFLQQKVSGVEHATPAIFSGVCVHTRVCPLRQFLALIVWREELLSPGSDIMRKSLLNMICSSFKWASWKSSSLKQLCNGSDSWVHMLSLSPSVGVLGGVWGRGVLMCETQMQKKQSHQSLPSCVHPELSHTV